MNPIDIDTREIGFCFCLGPVDAGEAIEEWRGGGWSLHWMSPQGGYSDGDTAAQDSGLWMCFTRPLKKKSRTKG